LIKHNDKKRIAYAFRRAQKSIFVTSTTTCVAFSANAFSDLVPIRAFGIFAAIIVPVNYLMDIFIMPAAIIIHENYLRRQNPKVPTRKIKYKFQCCILPVEDESRDNLDLPPYEPNFIERFLCNFKRFNKNGTILPESSSRDSTNDNEKGSRNTTPDYEAMDKKEMRGLRHQKPTLVKKKSTDMDLEKLDKLTQFFAGPCNKFVHKSAYIIILVMTLFGIGMFANAVRMAPLSK
jgi:hypothetical protein